MDGGLAIVFGGGGARAALQVGAARVLWEEGYFPDLVAGTSAGAMNAAYLAVHGWTRAGLDGLADAWHCAAAMDLLPANYVWSTLRAMRRGGLTSPSDRLRDFLVGHGIAPGLRFKALSNPRLVVVSSNLTTASPVFHGLAEDEAVLDAILVSTALPPWVLPKRRGGDLLMDGALVSGLPIDAALAAGARHIIALDLLDAREPFGQAHGFGLLINRLTHAVEQRRVEQALAAARAGGASVLYCGLAARDLVPIWDFSCTDDLLQEGYDLTRRLLHEQAEAATGALGSS